MTGATPAGRPGDHLRVVAGAAPAAGPAEATPEALMRRVALGDEAAFAALFDRLVGPVFGLVVQVVRDPAQSEEVTQEVLVEVWRTAARYDAARGSVLAWVTTLARRRAVDRVRSAQAGADRDARHAATTGDVAYDEVAEAVEHRLEQQAVRRCLGGLTELQRESVSLAYYRGLTQTEVADLLGVPLPTVKTRLRDGLIRLRDCLGVTA
ncbi:MAG: ECF RNA polymerase sigma factor SigK [Kineosporiaceae bacterium]